LNCSACRIRAPIQSGEARHANILVVREGNLPSWRTAAYDLGIMSMASDNASSQARLTAEKISPIGVYAFVG
jgi:hypothetical protein